MARNNKATAAQARYVEALAAKAGKEEFEAAYNRAARLNSNAPYANFETVTQAVRRLSKTAASKLIDDLTNN